MAFTIPLLAGLHAARGATQARARTPDIPLRQVPARPRQASGGSLHLDGASSQAAPALQQQTTKARQRFGASLRSSLSRLRARLQPGHRDPSSPATAAPLSRPETARSTDNTAEPISEAVPLRPPVIPQARPSRRRHLLEGIAEEKYAALQESQLNTMQLRARHAAEEDTAGHHTRLRPQFARLQLSDKGKLSVPDSVSENLTAVLNETLAREEHSWQAHQASADHCHHLLLDTDGRLFSLQGTKTGVIGLSSSQPVPGWRDLPAQQRLQALPDSSLHALLTGIYSHDKESESDGGDSRIKALESEQLREHGGRLYRLNEREMHWEPVDKNEEKTYGKLSRQPDDMLYAIYDKKTLHNLSTGEKSEKFKGKITGYCIGQHGTALALLSDEKTSKQSVVFLNSLGAKKEQQQTLSLNVAGSDTPFHATAIALHHARLFAIDSRGKLFSADAPTPGDTGVELREDLAATAQLAAQTGGAFTFSSLISQREGALLAQGKGSNDQKHLCQMDEQGVFQAQWNLSESLIFDHHEGLLQPRPLPQELVDLGRLGQLLTFEGKLYARDKNSGRWEASQEKADSIKRAQDGSGWALNEGIPSRIKVTQKSDKIDGRHHRFALRQLKTSLALELPLPGFDENHKARAIAPLDAENCAAIGEDNTLQYHRLLAGTRQPEKLMKTLTKAGIANWLPHLRPGVAESFAAKGEGNTLTDITTDQQHTLYVLDQQGKLYKMAEDEWRAAPGLRPDARWQSVPLPEELGPVERLHNMAGGALMVADKSGRSAVLQLANTPLDAETFQDSGESGGQTPPGNVVFNHHNAGQITAHDRWLIHPDYDPSKNLEAIAHRPEVMKAVSRLDEASKSYNLGGMTLKYETSIAGMTGRDGNHVNSRLRDRLGAHLFNTRNSTPRPMKNAWYAMQHNWQGRDGLRPLYEQQVQLHQAMKNVPLAVQPQVALHSRIAALASRPVDKTLLAHLKTLADNIADSAQHHSHLLGQHSGALRGDGSEEPAFTPSSVTAFTQALNPYSDDHNLLADLSMLYQRYPLRADNTNYAVIDTLRQKGVIAHHQKAHPPMGRLRDPHDDMGLVKSRLILDGLMMSELHELVTSIEQCGDSPAEAAAIKERFRVLRDERYGNNLVQKATSQGFINNSQLEACYDAIKSMINAFSKPHHGLNMTTRTVLKAADQQEMTTQLLRTLKALESGESMGFGRNYGAMVTVSVIPGGEVIGVPGVRGNLDRAYNASFSRGENGINVTFSRNGGGTGTVFGAVGWNPLNQLPDSASLKTDLGGDRSIAPSARLGGIIAMALQRQLQNSISFTLSEAELKPFVEQLTRGELNVNQLLDKGVSHRVKNGTTLSFNVDAAAIASLGAGLRFPTNSQDPKKNGAIARVSGNAQIGANILSAQSDHSVSHSAAGSSYSDSANRVRMLNTASASAGVAGGMGVSANAAAKLRIPMFGINSTNIQATIDNRTKHSMSLDIAKAEPVHKRQLDKLVEQVGMNFDDPQTNKLLQQLKDADKVAEKPKNELSTVIKALKEQQLRQRAEHPGRYRPLAKSERDALTLRKEEKESATDALASPGEEEKFSTFMRDEQTATAMKLDKLLPHLLAQIPANNGQYGVLLSARQLDFQRKALALHCQALNSAEYQSTYNNLRKVDSNNLMHVVHCLFASELPESAAESISRFMEEKPMLKAVIRELQRNRNTQAVVTLELKDSSKFELQQMWLNHETQPEDIQKRLRDRQHLRVKSIAFTETDTKQEGINVPLFVAGGASSASVSISRNLGKINFSYGADQQTPTAFTLEGEVAWAKQSLVDALTNAEIQDKRGRV